MGTYCKRSKASFRTPADPKGREATGDGSVEVKCEIWAGAPGWRRIVGTIEKVEDCDERGDCRMGWRVVDLYPFDGDRFDTLAKAKAAIRSTVNGGCVVINNSTDVDYLKRIEDRHGATIDFGE